MSKLFQIMMACLLLFCATNTVYSYDPEPERVKQKKRMRIVKEMLSIEQRKERIHFIENLILNTNKYNQDIYKFAIFHCIRRLKTIQKHEHVIIQYLKNSLFDRFFSGKAYFILVSKRNRYLVNRIFYINVIHHYMTKYYSKNIEPIDFIMQHMIRNTNFKFSWKKEVFKKLPPNIAKKYLRLLCSNKTIENCNP